MSIEDIVSDMASLDDLAKICAERSRPLTFLFGAGVSSGKQRSADGQRIPVWSALREQLTSTLRHQINAGAFGVQYSGPPVPAIEKETDPWNAFSLLLKDLGETTFHGEVRRCLTPKENATLPDFFKKIWGFHLNGIITTNLDPLLLNLFSTVSKTPILPIYGTEFKTKLATLRSRGSFFVQLHGLLDDAATWVLTRERLDEMLQSDAHRIFFETVYFNSTCIFIGMSVDDEAISSRLLKLREIVGHDIQHYWICPNTHAEKRDWAEKSGIRQIFYNTTHGHDAALSSILTYLATYRSYERTDYPSASTNSPPTSADLRPPAPDKLNRPGFAGGHLV